MKFKRSVEGAGFRFPSVPQFFFVREERGGAIATSAAAADLVRDEAQSDREWFQVLYLDGKHQLIEKRLEAFGSVNSAAIYPREILRSALFLGASSVVLLHNHPCGDPDPSICDRELTRDIVFAARCLQIRVLDHVIVGAKFSGEQKVFSFADQGLIDDYDRMYNGFPR